MTPEEIRSRSAEKVKQVTDLCRVLHLNVEAKQRIDQNGFLDNTVFFTDTEQYPQPPVEVPLPVPELAAKEAVAEAEAEAEALAEDPAAVETNA